MATRVALHREVLHTRLNADDQLSDYYTFGEKLGQGTFGTVLKAKSVKNGQLWAIKIINKEKAGGWKIRLLEREIDVLKQVSHEHIIHLEEVFETSQKVFLVIELCDKGELADLIVQKGIFTEENTRKVIYRLSSAISYLHTNDIVHRDLKMENILLSKNPTDDSDDVYIKVTDFSLAVVKGGAGQENMLQDSCGTPVYMAPELWDKKSYSQQCDVWSMGIIMYWLLCGSPPFIAPHTDALSTLIKQAKLNFGSPSWKDVSENAKFLIQGMLRVDPAHRLTASEVLHNPWTKGTSNTSSNSNFPQPSNVLEMMQMWHQELRHQEAPLQSVESENDSEWDISLDSSSQLQETTGKRQPEKSSLSSKSSSVTRGTKVRFTGKDNDL